jgi:peptidoglycan hydrolase-like protein with peptidoglycan-binding domain
MTRSVTALAVAAVLLLGTSAQAAGKKKARSAITRAEVVEVEKRLDEMGYWLSKADGVWDESSRHALIAFQKVEGLEVTGKLTLDLVATILEAEPPDPFEQSGAHVEIDIRNQVLYVVDDTGRVVKVLPVSTGSDEPMRVEGVSDYAYTPRGRFEVRSKVDGWKKSELGLLYYPNYILGGIAIHGNPAVPVVPASHGCIRVPMFAAKTLSSMLPVGTKVVVHDNGSLANVPTHIRKQVPTETEVVK